MPAPLSLDIRLRFQRCIEDGLSGREAARRLMISPASGARLAQRVRSGADYTGQMRAPGGLGQARAVQGLSAGGGCPGPRHHPARASGGAARSGRGPCQSDLAVARAWPSRLHLQKKSLVADEQRRPDVARARQDWIAHRLPAAQVRQERLVFIDETSVKTNMTRTRGRAPRGSACTPPPPSANGAPRPSSPG